MAIGWFVLADQVIETSIAEWPLMTQSGHMYSARIAVPSGPFASTKPVAKMLYVSMLRQPPCLFLKSSSSQTRWSFVPILSSRTGSGRLLLAESGHSAPDERRDKNVAFGRALA